MAIGGEIPAHVRIHAVDVERDNVVREVLLLGAAFGVIAAPAIPWPAAGRSRSVGGDRAVAHGRAARAAVKARD